MFDNYRVYNIETLPHKVSNQCLGCYWDQIFLSRSECDTQLSHLTFILTIISARREERSLRWLASLSLRSLRSEDTTSTCSCILRRIIQHCCLHISSVHAFPLTFNDPVFLEFKYAVGKCYQLIWLIYSWYPSTTSCQVREFPPQISPSLSLSSFLFITFEHMMTGRNYQTHTTFVISDPSTQEQDSVSKL